MNMYNVSRQHHLHHEQREDLVLLLHLPGADGVAVVVVGEHHEAAVGTDEQQAADPEHVPPDRSATRRGYNAMPSCWKCSLLT